mmetsp:Transcript_22782/g.56840  ORF Transcript_22782/g.56840 Transcript_22782/m.56840 type:complete len:375 (-) Transcript_22782:222-1346(-)
MRRRAGLRKQARVHPARALALAAREILQRPIERGHEPARPGFQVGGELGRPGARCTRPRVQHATHSHVCVQRVGRVSPPSAPPPRHITVTPTWPGSTAPGTAPSVRERRAQISHFVSCAVPEDHHPGLYFLSGRSATSASSSTPVSHCALMDEATAPCRALSLGPRSESKGPGPCSCCAPACSSSIGSVLRAEARRAYDPSVMSTALRRRWNTSPRDMPLTSINFDLKLQPRVSCSLCRGSRSAFAASSASSCAAPSRMCAARRCTCTSESLIAVMPVIGAPVVTSKAIRTARKLIGWMHLGTALSSSVDGCGPSARSTRKVSGGSGAPGPSGALCLYATRSAHLTQLSRHCFSTPAGRRRKTGLASSSLARRR